MSRFNLLEGPINVQMGNIVSSAYNEHEEDYLFQLTSEGGTTAICSWIVDLMNLHKESTTLIGCEYLYSAGFDLFFSFKGHRILKEGTTGLVHKAHLEAAHNGNKFVSPVFEAFSKEMKKNRKVKMYREIGLTEKQIKRYKKGEDVIITYSQMKKLLENDIKQTRSNDKE